MVIVHSTSSKPLPQPPLPPKRRRSTFLSTLLPILTTTSHTSALLFSSFLIVHLSSPLSSSVHLIKNAGTSASASASAIAQGSTDVASKWQILGRVYYQNVNLGTEAVIVWGSLGVHLLSSVLKRGVAAWMKWKRGGDGYTLHAGPPQQQAQTTWTAWWPSLHTATSYLLTPLVLHHILLHRILPSSDSHPINNLSPSELDHNFTSYGLQRYPWTSWITLGALTVIGGIHVAGGVGIIGKRLGGAKKAAAAAAARRKEEQEEEQERERLPMPVQQSNHKKTKRSTKSRSPVPPALFVSALILTGVWGISRDPDSKIDSTSTWMTRRYDAVYRQLWPFSAIK